MKKISAIMLVLITSLTTYGQSKRAEKGYYYDKKGNKHEGMFVYHVNRIRGEADYLEEYKNGKKVKDQKLNTETVESFVLKSDSFTVVKDFTVGNGMSKSSIPHGFAKVICSGVLNLYSYRAIPQGSTGGYTAGAEVYLIRVEGTDDYETINRSLGMKKELSKVSDLMVDNKELAEKISNLKNNKELMANIEKYVRKYNTWKLEN